MPSIFLETFGLSALESLSMGVPVAGFSKGGIAPFLVSEELRISNRSVTGGFVSLLSVSDKLIAEWKARAFEVSLRYSKERFRERLSSILPDSTKRILLITDFTSSIGGIETYVRNLESALREFGFDVRTVGSPDGFSTRFQKGVSTLVSFWNPVAKNELSREIADFSPDVVWCHSLLRRYGPKGLDAVFDFPSFRMMTYHDLGYFAPFAAQCFEESDIPSPGFFPFIAKASGIFGKIFSILKYLKLRMIFDRLSRFDVHLVPSDFVAPFVSAKIPGAKVVVLPHYVSFP